MDDQLRLLYQDRAGHPDTLGVLLIERKDMLSPVTDGFDALLLVVTQDLQKPWYAKHYHYEDKKVQVITISGKELNQWLAAGSNRRAVEWMLQGHILFDRNEYLGSLRMRLESFPFDERKKKLCMEFAGLIRSYQEGKELLRSGDNLDAFNHILEALHHWARLAVIENGFHPEVTLWKQVKKIEPEIHKLYDELVMGGEPLKKRIELLLLANEFSVMSKTELGTAHLTDVMSKKGDPWEFEELLQQQEIKDYALDLGILLEHLVKKQLVEEIFSEKRHNDIQKRSYLLKAN